MNKEKIRELVTNVRNTELFPSLRSAITFAENYFEQNQVETKIVGLSDEHWYDLANYIANFTDSDDIDADDYYVQLKRWESNHMFTS